MWTQCDQLIKGFKGHPSTWRQIERYFWKEDKNHLYEKKIYWFAFVVVGRPIWSALCLHSIKKATKTPFGGQITESPN